MADALYSAPDQNSVYAVWPYAKSSMQLPEWLQDNLLAKQLLALAATLLAFGGATWVVRRNSPIPEMERARDSVAGV